MSAGSFHHGMEREIKKQSGGGALYDFNDFVNVIKASNGQKVDVYEMQNVDFFSWQQGHSAAKLQKKIDQYSQILQNCNFAEIVRNFFLKTVILKKILLSSIF